jgi:hypothetical protein
MLDPKRIELTVVLDHMWVSRLDKLAHTPIPRVTRVNASDAHLCQSSRSINPTTSRTIYELPNKIRTLKPLQDLHRVHFIHISAFALFAKHSHTLEISNSGLPSKSLLQCSSIE